MRWGLNRYPSHCEFNALTLKVTLPKGFSLLTLYLHSTNQGPWIFAIRSMQIEKASTLKFLMKKTEKFEEASFLALHFKRF